jgi:hypothetical protein
VYEGYFYENK